MERQPDQKSLSPSLGKEVMSPIGLAGVTSQRPDKDLDGGLTYLPQLNVASRTPQCYGSLFMQRRRKRVQHPRPSKQTHIKTRHSLPAAVMGLAEEEKHPNKELGEGIKHAERKVPQHIRSADSSLCMRRKHRRGHPQPSEESHIQTSCSLPAAVLISAEEENKSGKRTTVLNEETLVLQSLETSPDNIPEEENRSAALRGGTVEQEGEGRDQEVGQ
ncbi:UNVERIFIED_CONTAM: hypothetical protein FKN15_059712 [Acipenser sinensis]